VPDIAGLHHFGDCTDRVFNWHVRVKARGAVDVDMINAKASQCIGECGFYGGWTRVEADPVAGRIALRTKFTLSNALSHERPLMASAISVSLWPMP
jgi:hypothetical protein